MREKIKEIGGIKVLAHRVDNLERPQMRTLVDQLRDKIGSGVVVLGSANDGNVSLIVGVTKDLTGRDAGGQSDCRRSRRKWAAKAAGVPTWPKPAEKIQARWMRRWARFTAWWRACCTRNKRSLEMAI